MTDPDFTFPVIAIRGGRGDLETFRDAKLWELGGDVGIGFGAGTLLVDASGRAWDVLGRQTEWSEFNLWRRVAAKLFKVAPPVELSYSERAPMAWDELVERVCASIGANFDDWRNDRLALGLDGAEPMDDAVQMDILKGQVRRARTLDQLNTLIYWTDWDDRPSLVAGWAEA